MISNAALSIIDALLSFIAGLLPAGVATANAGIVGAVATANGYISALNDFLPNPQLLGATAVLFVFEIAYATYKVIKWGYIKIPGIS